MVFELIGVKLTVAFDRDQKRVVEAWSKSRRKKIIGATGMRHLVVRASVGESKIDCENGDREDQEERR